MRRPTVRVLALFVLALLGAPVAMHVVMHDLYGHEVEHAAASMGAGNHTDHEHPIIVSAPSQPTLILAAEPVVEAPLRQPPQGLRIAMDARNLIAHGAIHSADEDVGLHTLLSTFLI